MPTKKITELPAASSVIATDLVPMVDDPSGTAVTQKATWSLVRNYVLGISGGNVVIPEKVTTTFATANAKWLAGPTKAASSRGYSELHGVFFQSGSGDATSDILCNAYWSDNDGAYVYASAEAATLIQMGDSSAITLWSASAGTAGTAISFVRGWSVGNTTGHMGITVASSSSTILNLPASTTSVSSIRVAHGVAPSSPVNGDIWTTSAGMFVRINGVTKTVTLT